MQSLESLRVERQVSRRDFKTIECYYALVWNREFAQELWTSSIRETK